MDCLHASVEDLTALLAGKRVAVLTGAGISTESGIPDYRGPETARRARKPMRFQEYASSVEGRARYWARSMLGWPRFAAARPNAGHEALVELEHAGAVCGIITQNIDRLHHAAGSRRVIELHGALAEVRCLSCDASEARTHLQERLASHNPQLLAADAALAPDGDSDLAWHLYQDFRVPNCLACDGILKPNVVFFGESVPRRVVDSAYALLDEAEALLVLGSSLAVYSGFRFVRRAHERQLPIAIVTLGQTRADALAHVRADQKIGEILPLVARRWLGQSASNLTQN
jgi:NAD-dependent SIR2 family protein deacetylase